MSGAYYSEIDPKAAATLRVLIEEGHIAPGDVDERSIEDVSPAELVGYTQRHFFAGGGVWSASLRARGWPDDRPCVTGSCPCQPFSAAGKGAGLADERHLWPALYWHIALGRPCTVFGEQVSSDDGLAWFDVVSADLERANYTVGAVDTCAAGFGAPHIRQRLYWMAVPGSFRLRTRRASIAGRQSGNALSQHGSLLDGVAHPESLGKWTGHGHLGQGREWGNLPSNSSNAGGLADADGGNTSEGREQRSGQHGLVEEDCGTRGLADTGNRLVQESQRGAEGGDGLRPASPLYHGSPRPGPTNGFWRTADWLRCRPEPGYPNGRWRPVESGTQPLAHGYPQRMGILRLAGNAIVGPAAEGNIEAGLAALEELGWDCW